jgi:3',5'-cyclic AMP phosphodiesterase CpdA
MAESINWLHLTDLHLGLDDQGWLWPQVKHEFFRDIAQLAGDIGGWDLVFFTGDLTQRGSKAEFDCLSRELEELWVVLAKSGSTPRLCLILGNHDLDRPPSDSAIAKPRRKII